MPDSILWLEPKKEILQNAATSNSDGEILALKGKYGSLALQVSDTFSATVNFEATYDGVNYISIRGINVNTGNGATSTTTPGVFLFSALGIYKFRARISGYSSGAVTVTAIATASGIPTNQATTTTGTVAIDQSTPGVSNAVQLTGSNIEIMTLVNAQAITDTIARTVTVTVTKYRDFDFEITNTHNQPVTIGFKIGSTYYDLLKTDGTIINYWRQHSIPAGAFFMYLSAKPLSGFTKTLPYKDFTGSFSLEYEFTTAPTVGSLTIKLIGRG